MQTKRNTLQSRKEKDMTNLELAVRILADYYENTINEDYSDWGIESWSEMVKAFGQDSDDVMEDVNSILDDYCTENNTQSVMLTADFEIEEADGFVSYRKLMNEVRKELKRRGVFSK